MFSFRWPFKKQPDEEIVWKKVRAIIAEQLTIDAEKITPDASFTEDLGAGSLDMACLELALEEELHFKLKHELWISNIPTVQSLLDFLEELSIYTPRLTRKGV